jgi:hypothetical protein
MLRMWNRQRFLWIVASYLIFCGMLPLWTRADLSEDGPFPVGTSTVTVTRPGGSTFTALLYYPAESAGNHARLFDQLLWALPSR